jgi:non-specific protein-tyrosine kinase
MVAGGAAYAGSQRQPITYTAKTTLLINAGDANRDGLSLSSQDEREYLVNTYVALLNKRPVFAQVIESLSLDMSPGELAQNVSIDPVQNTQLLEIRVEDIDPQRSAAIANEIVAVFNQQEAELTANPYAANRPSLHVVESAIPPTSTNGISSTQLILLAVIVGALLGIGAAILVEYLDVSVRSATNIERLTGWTTLAEIPKIRGIKPHNKLVTLKDSRSAEAYQMVRAHLEHAAKGRPILTLMVTSGRPGEGKSVTSANLAVALAQTGLRVILIDTNLRNPTLHTLFQQKNEYGFTTAIQQQGQQPATTYLVHGGVENLQLLLSGPVQAPPPRLLSRMSLNHLITELQDEADLILFDSPPLLHVLDTTLIMHATDATLYVVRAGKTNQDTLMQALQHFNQAQTRMLGAMLVGGSSGNTRLYGDVVSATSVGTLTPSTHQTPASTWPTGQHPNQQAAATEAVQRSTTAVNMSAHVREQ